MKFLIAFAVFAVALAAAQIRVVHLPPAPAPAYEVPDIRPLIVAQSVLEALAAINVHDHQNILRDNFVDEPIDMAYVEPIVAYRASEAEGTYFEDFEPSADEESMKVKVVDIPFASYAATDAEETNAGDSSKDRFVDAPVVAYENTVAEEDDENVADEESMKINVVDIPFKSYAATDSEETNADDSAKVRFVDAPVVAYENTVAEEDDENVADEESMKINVVDIPFESYAETDAEETDADDSLNVRFVDASVVAYENTMAEESNAEFQYAEEPIKIADVSFSNEDSFKVNIVDAPVQAEAFDTVKVVDPVFENIPAVEPIMVVDPVFENIPAVEPIKVAEIPRFIKAFADPRLR